MPLHDVGYHGWQGRLTGRWAAVGAIASTGIRLAWASRWLRRAVLFAWSPAILFAASFFAFERPSASTILRRDGDSLRAGPLAFGFTGRGRVDSLRPVHASQEFWHSWQSFHPRTTRYP